MQTEDNLVPGICFSPQKKKQFDTVEQKKSPLKLSSFKLSDKLGPLKDVADIDQPINFVPIAGSPASKLVKISTVQKFPLDSL